MANPLSIKIEMRKDLVTPRTHNRIMLQINRELGEHHKKHTIKKHFENVPETRPGGAYGYEKRGQRYAYRKQRKVGHRKPNVYSGRMRSTVLSAGIVRQTKSRWTFTAKNYFPMRAAQRDELEAVASGEVDEMLKRIRRRYIELANRPENRRKRRERVKK